MSTVESDLKSEFDDILTEKQVVEHELYPFLSPIGRSAERERIRQSHTKPEIYARISGSLYQGERVSSGWGKDVLINAYIEMRQGQLQVRLASLNRRMCGILGWDYSKMER